MTGSVTVTGSLAVVTNGTEFQVTNTGVRLGNVSTDAHLITGSVNVSGSATFSSSLLANGIMSLGDDGTYGSTYKTLGLTGNANGSHRILAGTSDDMYLTAATGRGIYFWTDGVSTTRMRILANGNIGIATSSPTVSQTGLGMQMGDGTNNVGFRYNVGAGSWGYTEYYQDSTAKWITGYRDADGSFNIKTGTNLSSGNGFTITSVGYLRHKANGGSYFNGPYNEICNLNGGNADIDLVLGLGGSSNNTNSYFLICAPNNAGDRMYIYGNGNIVNTNGSYGTISDASLKENIIDTTPKLNDLLQLKVRNFNLINDEDKTKQIGFIAQEFEEVFPTMVDTDGKSGMKTIKTSVLVPMLVKAIQEQQAQIEELKSQINK
jgi:hypothetical protein